jgi:hypothetical protein
MMNTEIDLAELSRVRGGMNIEGFRRSENIEDRRGMSLEDSMNAPTPRTDPLPPLTRTPGDLSSQAGLDDIGTSLGGGGGPSIGTGDLGS